MWRFLVNKVKIWSSERPHRARPEQTDQSAMQKNAELRRTPENRDGLRAHSPAKAAKAKDMKGCHSASSDALSNGRIGSRAIKENYRIRMLPRNMSISNGIPRRTRTNSTPNGRGAKELPSSCGKIAANSGEFDEIWLTFNCPLRSRSERRFPKRPIARPHLHI